MQMSKRNVINATTNHNASITARPAILIPATDQKNDGVVIQMGKAGPQILDFQKEGVPRYADWNLEQLQPIRAFTSAFMSPGSPEHMEMEANTTKKDRDTLHGLLRLRYTHERFPVNEKAAKSELSHASSALIEDPRIRATFAGGKLPQVAAWFYPAFFNRGLKRARLVLWLTKQNQFLPAIFCPDMKTATFAFAAFRGVVACANCGELFTLDSERVDKSRGEKYCTAACGQRFRQKAYRQRVRGKATTRKRRKKRSEGR
jgi:hypothetical protein